MRLKSFDDLQKLWVICVREQNYLHTQSFWRKIKAKDTSTVRMKQVRDLMLSPFCCGFYPHAVLACTTDNNAHFHVYFMLCPFSEFLITAGETDHGKDQADFVRAGLC